MADRANQSHMTFLIIDETAWLVSWWMFVKLYVLWAWPCQYCPPLKWQIWSRMMKNRSIMCWTSQAFVFFWHTLKKTVPLLYFLTSHFCKFGQIWANIFFMDRFEMCHIWNVSQELFYSLFACSFILFFALFIVNNVKCIFCESNVKCLWGYGLMPNYCNIKVKANQTSSIRKQKKPMCCPLNSKVT